MTTKEIMDIALELAGITEIPQDSDINVPGANIKRVLAGIDINSAEILAAHQLGYDCVLRHHPRGYKMASVGDMEVRDHMEMMLQNGVPINIAQKVATPRKKRMNHSMHAYNLVEQVQFASLLGVSFLSIHTPADLILEHELQNRMKKLTESKEKVILKDILENLRQIPEFTKTPVGPEIWLGDDSSYGGKIMVTMAGGGAPSTEEYIACINAGVGTIITMHIYDDTLEAIEKDGRCNLIVTGHYPSDSYGINRILDELVNRGIEVTRIGGIVY